MTALNEARHGVTQWLAAGALAPNTDLPHPTLRSMMWNGNGLQPTRGLEASMFYPTLLALLQAA